MRDTTPDFQRFVDAQYARLTSGERVRLCTVMFDAARALVESSLPEGLSEYERKRQLTERFYGSDFANRVFPPTGGVKSAPTRNPTGPGLT